MATSLALRVPAHNNNIKKFYYSKLNAVFAYLDDGGQYDKDNLSDKHHDGNFMLLSSHGGRQAQSTTEIFLSEGAGRGRLRAVSWYYGGNTTHEIANG